MHERRWWWCCELLIWFFEQWTATRKSSNPLVFVISSLHVPRLIFWGEETESVLNVDVGGFVHLFCNDWWGISHFFSLFYRRRASVSSISGGYCWHGSFRDETWGLFFFFLRERNVPSAWCTSRRCQKIIFKKISFFATDSNNLFLGIVFLVKKAWK